MPILIVNFKNYPGTFGDGGYELASLLDEKAAEFPEQEVVLATSLVNISRFSNSFDLSIFAQHVDGFGMGKTTGYVPPEVVQKLGVEGTLLNHSEHPLVLEVLYDVVARCRKVGLQSVVCADSVEMVSKIAEFVPDFIAYEPPELVGSGTSVTSARRDVVREAVDKAGEIPLLVGAGIHCQEDAVKALDLGAVGILVSSFVVKSSNPGSSLEQLLSGLSL